MHVITETADLLAACRRLASLDFVTVDTEFMRESTFWPELCLIQIAGGEDELLVDPLSPGLSLAPFFDLMADDRVVKVFHAARQDIEIIFQKAGVIPQPIFDTQVAAMVCGFGESVSFSNLVKKVVGADVDKSSQFTDWKRRPLSTKQLTYALGDVTHLKPIYLHLAAELSRSGRAHWLEQEMAALTAQETYDLHPEKAWQRLKLRVRSRKSLAVLIEVAEWRERNAQSQNVPRARIIKDDAIYDVANQMPQTTEQLSELRTIHDGFARSARGQELLAAVKRGLGRDVKLLPALDRQVQLSAEALALLDLLKVLLKSAAAAHGVAPKMIATTDDLERLAQEAEPDIPALSGWRRELFGEKAVALKAGKLALAVRNGAVTVVETL
jgi:ribonuclease D